MRNRPARSHVVSTLAIMTGLGMFQLFSGCMTLEEMAPPVGDAFQMIAARHSVDATMLELGREVYISDCAQCHSVEPIGRYSTEHWVEVLPEMARKTLLDKQRTEAVKTYVTLALVYLHESAKAEAEAATSGEPIPQENASAISAARANR